jgi:hypothetical protein
MLQVYDTREDNLIIEAPVIFGSGLQVRVSAKLRVPGTGYAVYLPVEVSSIQVGSSPAIYACHHALSRHVCLFSTYVTTGRRGCAQAPVWLYILVVDARSAYHAMQLRAVARITMSPIVETLPCVGGVTITLLKVRAAARCNSAGATTRRRRLFCVADSPVAFSAGAIL